MKSAIAISAIALRAHRALRATEQGRHFEARALLVMRQSIKGAARAFARLEQLSAAWGSTPVDVDGADHTSVELSTPVAAKQEATVRKTVRPKPVTPRSPAGSSSTAAATKQIRTAKASAPKSPPRRSTAKKKPDLDGQISN